MANKKLLKIMVLSDLHYGSNTFNEPLFEKWLQIAKASRNKIILLNGDLIDNLDANRFYKPKDYINVNDQLNYVINSLRPFKKDIICNLRGNHGIRTKRQYDLDLDQIIGDELGVSTTKSFHEDICIKRGKHPEYLRVFSQHEAPTSKSTLLAMRRFISQMENIDADLYFGSHNHLCMFVTKIYRGLNYSPIRRSYCFTGSFLDYKDSYADNGRYDFNIPSFPVLTVDKEKTINCKTYWSDGIEEVR